MRQTHRSVWMRSTPNREDFPDGAVITPFRGPSKPTAETISGSTKKSIRLFSRRAL